MNKFAFAAPAATAPLVPALAVPTPCETALKDLRPAEVKATLNDVGENKVYDLEITGIGRCHADDDKRADELFARAMKVLGR